MSVMDETLVSEVVFVDNAPEPTSEEVAAYFDNENQVMHHNMEAMRVETEHLDAFLELVYATDPEYMDTQQYMPQPEPENMLDWETVSAALGESQKIMIAMQELLSETLAEMGVEGHDSIRVYSDTDGAMRLLVDHPRREEIETVLNSRENRHLRDLYASATAGMSIAGSLVGNMSVPEEVLEQIKAKQYSSAV